MKLVPYRGSNSWVDFILWRRRRRREKKNRFDCQQNSKSANWLRENRTGRCDEELASNIWRILRKLLKGCDPQTRGSGFKTERVWSSIATAGGGRRSAVQHLPPLSSDLMEEGGSHTVLFSYKGSKGPSYPRRTDSVGRPSETERGRLMRADTTTRY